jgi:hypothetical protein
MTRPIASTPRHRPLSRLAVVVAPAVLILASAAVSTGCGGSGKSAAAAPPPLLAAPAPAPAAQAPAAPAPAQPPVTGLAGTVAVGAPMVDASVRIVDANGTTVAADVPVDAQGRYELATLPGTGPWRVEACGYAGANWQCHQTVVAAPGTAHVTPLTTATLLLAAGRSPGAVMGRDGSAPDADALARAQRQLRSALGDTLNGNVPEGFDFLSGELAAGSRVGYDRLLDALGVATGEDGAAFVQVTPRLGSGNLYLESGTTLGRLTPAAAAHTVDLSGVEALFGRLNRALAGRSACLDAAAGMASQMASNARLSFEVEAIEGAEAVGLALCAMFEMDNLWGARFVSPTLGRCDLSGALPTCRIGFALQRAGDQAVESVGDGFAVTLEGGRWRFAGEADAVPIRVAARVQLNRRIDGDTPFDSWDRALSFEVPALPGLACARVSQRDASGASVPMALLKPSTGTGEPARRLSMWRSTNAGNSASLVPSSGLLRNSDDSWLILPEGADGDGVIRNFLRGGRTVTVALYADSGCSNAFQVAGRSSFEIEVGGVPPVASALASLPWPDLTAASRLALRDLALPSGDRSLGVAWTFPRGPLGVRQAVFCTDRPSCGDGQPGRVGDIAVRAGSTSVTMSLANRGSAVGADGNKVLMLHGTAADGTSLSAVFLSCPGTPAGQHCRD